MRTVEKSGQLCILFIFCLGVACLALPGIASAAGRTTVEGTIENLHSDNLKTGKSTDHYYVRVSKRRAIRLTLENRNRQLRGGKRALVKGRLRGNTLDVSGLEYKPGARASVAKTGPHTVLVIPLRYRNDPRAYPLPVDTLRARVFSGTDSANNFFKEVSNNKMSLVGKPGVNGDVLPWQDLPIDIPAAGTCNITNISNHVTVPAGYDHYMYVVNKPDTCPTTAWGDVPGKRSWYPIHSGPNGGVQWPIVGHELGHNLSLAHASQFLCSEPNAQTTGIHEVPISNDCVHVEYGDPWDTMGKVSSNSHHYSGPRKADLGWLSGTTKTVTADGTYPLQPSVSSSLYTGTQVLRVAVNKNIGGKATSFVYVDWRQNFGAFDLFSGSDPALNGVTVRLGSDYGQTGNTWVLDNHPLVSNGDPVQAPVAVGEALDDPETISIKTVSISAADSRCSGKPCAMVEIAGLRGKVEKVGSKLIYKAGYNEQNDVQISAGTGRISFREDNGYPLDPGAGCVRNTTTPTRIDCNPSGVTAIEANGKDRNDVISAGTLTVPMTLRGGSGDDYLRGSNGDDFLIGNLGNDSMYGDPGNDIITDNDGGGDIDYLSGGSGNDKLYARDGDNSDKLLCSTGTGEQFFGDSGDYKSGCELIVG